MTEKKTGFDEAMEIADCAFSTQFEIDNSRMFHSNKRTGRKLCPKRD